MASTLLLLALSLPPQAPSTSPFEIVRTWTGKEYDHLGIGISALGDVNGDGTPDFVLGAMQGAYTFCFGPGYAEVVSGKDGRVLYTVRGTNKDGDCGDAYGDTIAALGDLDKDGVPDFAVGAWRYEGYRGYVAIYSGRTGSPLATLYGGGTLTRGKGPVAPGDCDGIGPGLGKSIVPLGDLDGDSVPDFSIGSDFDSGPTWIVSGAELGVRGPLRGIVIGRTGEGEGRLLFRDSPGRLLLLSGRKLESTKMLSNEGDWNTCSAGDIDHDGWADLLRVKQRVRSHLEGPGLPSSVPVQFLSGKDGSVLRKLKLECPGTPEDGGAGSLGDLNGDGRPEVFVRAYLRTLGSYLWILDGQTGGVLAQELRPSWTFGTQIVPLGDIDRDGRPEFLLSEYESQEGACCGGAVHLVRIRLAGK
jgi:hypothetical protein